MNAYPRLILCLLAVLGLSTASDAQVRHCGTMEYLEQQIQNNPERALQLQSIDRHLKDTQQQNRPSVPGTIVIPTVVHIVYGNSAENISDAQVQSQIDVLNEDFRRLNADTSDTPSIFLGVAADAEIEFCLALVDPNGLSTTGITRTATTHGPFGLSNDVKFDATGGKDAWPTGDYLNLWICNIGGGTLGYAQFPGGPANTDGVVNDYRYTGRGGSTQAPFDLGRTATHEVGHWLNLRHIWGDGNCNVDDLVGDTPTAGGPNYTGSPCTFPGPNSCDDGPGDQPDMFQNYMDYSDDECFNLFTEGQKTRMRALFEPGGFRESLLSSNGCGQVATCSDGIQNGDETGVDCGGAMCPACPCNGNALTLTITLDDYPEETSWEITDAGNNVVASGGTYDAQPDGSTVVENINLADGDYTFTIYDSFGDGICCVYGNGSYTLSDGTSTIASGGEFGFSESTEFCIGGAAPTCSDGIQNGNEAGVDCGGPDCPPCLTMLLASPIIFLEGPYSPTTGLMHDGLRLNAGLPLGEPYTALGYAQVGGGGESTLPAVLDISSIDAIVDWVFLELRDGADATIVIATRSALLQRDGDVVDVDGLSPVAFADVPEGDYYLAVKHRNHLGVMSATPVAFSASTTVVDYTGNISNTFGGINGIADLGDGNLGLFSGDFDRNGQVQNTDYAAMVLTLGAAGYLPGDLDLNGQAQNTDVQFMLLPNLGKGQQFP